MKTEDIFGVKSGKLPAGANIQADSFNGQPAKYLTQAEQDAQAKPQNKVFKTADLFGKPSAVKKAAVFKTADLFGPTSKSPEVQKAEHANALERMVWTNWAGIDPAFVDEYKTRDHSAQEKLANAIIGPAAAFIPGQTGRSARESLIIGLTPIAEVFNRFLERPLASQLVPLAKNIFLGEPLPEGEPPKFIKDHLPKEMQDPQVWGGIRNLLNAYFTVKPSEFEQLRGYKLNKERPDIGDIFRARNAALGIDPKIGEPLASIGGLAARTLMPDVYSGTKMIAKKTPGAIKTTAELFGEGAQVTGTIIKETAKEIPGAVKAGAKGLKEAVSETAKGAVDQIVGNVDALYNNFKGTTDKQTFIKMMTEKGYAKDVSKKLADAFDDFVKNNGPQAVMEPEYVTKALFNVERPGISVKAEAKAAQDLAGEVSGVRTQVEQLEKTAKDLVAAGKPVPKDFLDNIEKLKASAPMPELTPRENVKKAGEPVVEDPKDESFDLAVDYVEGKIRDGLNEKQIKTMNTGTIVGKGTSLDMKTWTSEKGNKVDVEEVYKEASKRFKEAESLKIEESKVEKLKGKRSKKAVQERAKSEEKIEKAKAPKAKKSKFDQDHIVTPEAESVISRMVGSDATVKRTDENADGTNKYWVNLETEHGGYKISAGVRKSDGFKGHKPTTWTIKDAEDNYYRAPNFETFEEVKKWIDEGAPDILTEGELEDAKLEEVKETIKYLSKKKDLTDKEKRVLDASKNQVSIRKELGVDEDDEIHSFETSGMPVKLTEDKAILKDGTIIRRTPKGQPTVKDLVSEGDHISVQSSDYDDDGNLIYDDKSVYMVTKVTEWKKNGLPVYQIAYTSIDTPRNKDGSIKKGNESYTGVLVAQDGKIKPFNEKSNFPQNIEVVAKAGQTSDVSTKGKSSLTLSYNGKEYPVDSIDQASAMWNKVRDEGMKKGLSPKNMEGTPTVIDANGNALGTITWNGSFAMLGSPEGTVQAIINRIFDGPEGDIADGEAYIARLEREKKAIETEGNTEFRYEKNLTEMTAKQRELDKKLRELAIKKDEPKSPDVAQEIQEQAAPLTDDLMNDPEAGFARVSTGEKINDDIQAVQFSDPEIEKRFKDANGMASKQSLKQSIYDLWAGALSQLRQYPTLPEKKEFFPIKQILDKQKNVRKVAQDRAIRSINAITAKLGPKKLDLFTRKVILDDLFREARAGRAVPFGYSEIDPETGVLTIRMETLEKDKANIDALVERNPDVKDAVLMRSRLWDAVQQDLIRYKILKESQVKEDYFRHQVLEHAQLKATFGPGKRIRTPTPGYAKQRRGSTFDINSSYLEAEMEVLSQSFHDIETARNIESIENSDLNILKSLKAKAKAENEANILGYFQKVIETEQAKGNPEYLGDTAKSLYKKTLNVKQAMGIAKISRMASEGLLPTGDNDEWEDVINSLAERYTDGEGAEIEDGRLFKYLAYLSKLKDEAGAKAAALVFAGISEKKRFFIETLGEKFKTWEDMIPEGYRTWQPLEGRVFYSAYSVPQKVVSEVMSNTTPEMGEYGITKDDLRKVMAVGGLRKQLVLPEEVAATLDELYTAPPLSAVFKAARQLTTMWKLNILFNPRRAFKYNFQNFIGDSDAIIAGNPKIFKKLGRAFGDLKGVFYLNKPMPTEMREYFERGGLDSALTIQEIPDIKKLEIFERFFADTEKKNKGGWDSTFIAKGMNAYWNTITQFTVFREAILRYSAYLHYREVFKAGGKEYAASNPEEIDALEDPLDKAAKVATELLGDYKAVSALTQNMRQFLIPFMSWLEVNAKRYYRLGRNAWAGGDAGAGGRLAGVALKKGAMGLGKWWLRAVAMTAFCSLWNQLFFYEEEGQVSEYDRNRMHLILGRRSDGSIIILRGQGAFADILEWFGLDGAPQLFREYFDGKASLVDIFGKIPFITGKIGLKPAAQKIIRGINPLYKLPFETLTGKTLPVFDDRPGRIEDPMRNIFKSLALENEYDFIAQKPTRGYVNSLIQAFVAVQDPEENAFRYIQSQKYEFLEKRHGKGGGGDYYSKKSILYRAYRKALVLKDEAAQNRLIDEMDNLGIKGDDLTKSLERSHPLSGLTKAEEKEFTQDFLSDADLDKLESAEQYYEKTFLS